MNVTILHPLHRKHRPFLEDQAIRIFAGIGGATRPKVRKSLMAAAISAGLPRPVAEADVELAMAWLERRIELYGAAREIDPTGEAMWRVRHEA